MKIKKNGIKDWQNIIYMELFISSVLSEGRTGVRILHEDRWPVERLAKRIVEALREAKDMSHKR